MRIIAVVQARHSSRRLPGKVLRPMAGRPMLGWLLAALGHARELDGLVLATSVAADDAAVAAYATEVGVACHRGPLDDVAARLIAAARARGAHALVRLSGDSPLLDPALVDCAVALFRQGGADIVTNVQPRSFPKGQSVEVVALAALERAYREMTDDVQREHVTPYLYAHPERFAVRSFQAARPRPDLQLSVDEPAEFRRCEAVLTALGQAPWRAGWETCAVAMDAVLEAAA